MHLHWLSLAALQIHALGFELVWDLGVDHGDLAMLTVPCACRGSPHSRARWAPLALASGGLCGALRATVCCSARKGSLAPWPEVVASFGGVPALINTRATLFTIVSMG